MVRKTLVDLSLIKELSDSIYKKKKRGFKAKLKSCYTDGSSETSKKKYKKLRRLLLSSSKKKKNKTKQRDRTGKSSSKIKRTFNQFDSESTCVSESEPSTDQRSGCESSESEESESEKSEKISSSDENNRDSNSSDEEKSERNFE